MNKSIYSDEELDQLFQNLFIEKKKVIELEQKLQILHQEHQLLLSESKQVKTVSNSQKTNESEEIEKLKGMIATYKKKSAQAIHAFYENEHQKIKQETTLAHQLRQLQAHVHELTEENAALVEQQKLLRVRYDENAEELKTARQNLKRDNASVVKFEQERNVNQSLRVENQVMSQTLSEKQKLSEQLERALKHLRERSQEAQLELIQLREDFQRSREAISNLTGQLQLAQSRLHECTQELHKIQSEKQEALNETQALQEQFVGLKAKVVEGQEVLKAMTKEKMQLEVHLTDKTQLFNQLENEVSLIKQTLSKGMNEAKDIEGRYLGVVNEKAALYNRSTHLEQLLERHNNEISTLQQQREEAAKKEEALKIQLQQYQEEQDARIKVAHQHLGKKVKEVAFMSEKLEEQNTQITDLQGSLQQLKNNMAEMQTTFEQQLQQEKKHQEQLHETVRFAEGQVVKWEDKYLKTHEKLKGIEEKQQQMQLLFASLGNVMGSQHMPNAAAALPSPLSSHHYSPQKNTLHLVDTQNIQKQISEEHDQQKENSSTPTQPSLFDVEQPRTKIRQNLFD